MRAFLAISRRNSYFLLPHAAFLLVAGIFLLLYKKEAIHININTLYSSFGDAVMPWITLLGDGWTITIFVLLLFALNRRFAFFTGIACLLASGITQLLKHTIYYGEPRPAWLFTHHEIRFVPGVENNLYDSFPSGHTTVSFAFFFCLALLVKNPWLRLACFIAALLIGYSRVYLSQHFLGDVFGGSIIGAGTSWLVMTLAMQKKWMEI